MRAGLSRLRGRTTSAARTSSRKDQLRTLQMLHETFARLFAGSLSGYLRVPVHVDLVSVEQIPYDEYMRSLTSSIINVFSMAPLNGQAILEVEFNIILSMIDRLLGGPGSMVKNTSVLTDIERALTESIIDRALREFLHGLGRHRAVHAASAKSWRRRASSCRSFRRTTSSSPSSSRSKSAICAAR